MHVYLDGRRVYLDGKRVCLVVGVSTWWKACLSSNMHVHLVEGISTWMVGVSTWW